MRLTNTIRDAFVIAAMQDVPFIDYQEQAQNLAKEYCSKQFKKEMPKADDQALLKLGWIQPTSTMLPSPFCSAYLPLSKGWGYLQQDISVWDQLKVLAIEYGKQKTHLRELKSKLQGVAYACTTRKQLAEALPEFTKYLPAEDQPSRNLPAVANVVSDFVKAGWPKQNQGKIAAAKAAP